MSKRPLTAAERAARRRRRKETMIVFVNGKQRRVKRPPTVDGMDAEEFMLRNADPIWLHQQELWEYMPEPPRAPGPQAGSPGREATGRSPQQ